MPTLNNANLARFIKEVVRPFANTVVKIKTDGTVADVEYKRDLKTLVDAASASDDIDEDRDDGRPSRKVIELQAAMTVLDIAKCLTEIKDVASRDAVVAKLEALGETDEAIPDVEGIVLTFATKTPNP